MEIKTRERSGVALPLFYSRHYKQAIWRATSTFFVDCKSALNCSLPYQWLRQSEQRSCRLDGDSRFYKTKTLPLPLNDMFFIIFSTNLEDKISWPDSECAWQKGYNSFNSAKYWNFHVGVQGICLIKLEGHSSPFSTENGPFYRHKEQFSRWNKQFCSGSKCKKEAILCIIRPALYKVVYLFFPNKSFIFLDIKILMIDS